MVPTVLALIGVLIGAILTLWAIGFAIKKGLTAVMRWGKKSTI